MGGLNNLTTSQQALLNEWFGKLDVLEDYSWPLQDTTVVRIRVTGNDFIVKASRTSHHIAREAAAHRSFLANSTAPVAKLVYANVSEKILVTEYLPGNLVEGSPAEWVSSIYHQAGQILADLLIPGDTSEHYIDSLRERGLTLIDRAAGLASPSLTDLRARLETVVSQPVSLPAPELARPCGQGRRDRLRASGTASVN
jgi:hypothetical protein